MKKLLCAALVLGLSMASGQVNGQVVGFEGFDGNALNLTSGFTAADNIDGGPGDFYGIGNIAAFPSPSGVPFSLVDDSATVPGDLEGVYGQAADANNTFFAISDVRDETAAGPLTAMWTFDLTSETVEDLRLSIDMGQQSDGDSFGGISTADLVFEYSVDGGVFETAFGLGVTTNTTGFTFRALDDGVVPNAVGIVEVGNANAFKIDADTGLVSANTILNKTPATGPGAGLLDTFFTDFNAAGASTVDIRLTLTSFEFEGLAFDNITLTALAVPEPSSACILGFGILGLVVRRKRNA